MTWPPLAAAAARLTDALLDDADALGLSVSIGALGCTVLDAGIAARGGLEAGRRIAELCLGGLGRVTLGPGSGLERWPFAISVGAAQPVAACLLSQYAGWRLSADDWFALASGPGRAIAAVEPLYAELGYRDDGPRATLVLEVESPPPEAVVAEVAQACGLRPTALSFILTPTRSLAGTVQIVGRVLEVAVHKAHALGFALEHVIDGLARAPLPPPAPDFLAAMGRTNDAILYGGSVHLFVAGSDAAAADLAARLPSSASRDYGRPFAELFAAVAGDFYRIDPLLFSPAAVAVTALHSGRTFRGGALAPDLIDRSFGA